jgi:CRISPR-associated exonuclease Cas4
MITGTTFAYYHYCSKRMWLFHYGINMEQTSEIVADGKLIHNNTKNRRNKKYKELLLDGPRGYLLLNHSLNHL